jgi:hypothetical protein
MELAMKQVWKLGTGVILLVMTFAPTFAADDLTLVRILARADIAQNFAFYCAQYDPSIIERTKSSVGDTQALMLHIRSEVTSGLSQEETATVVLKSANAARTGALLAIRKQYGPNSGEERARLAQWCETSVVPSVKEFIARHDQHHELFDQAIRRAKQSRSSPQGAPPE